MDLPQRQRIAGYTASVERGLVGKRPQNGLEHLSITRSSASPSAGAFAGGMRVPWQLRCQKFSGGMKIASNFALVINDKYGT